MESKITFYQSYYEMALNLPEPSKTNFLMAVLIYAFEGIETDFGDDKMAEICFIGAKPNIDASIKRAKKMRENGSKGGRPAAKKPAVKPTVKPIGYSSVENAQKQGENTAKKPFGYRIENQTQNQSENQTETKALIKGEGIYKYKYPSPKAENDGSVNDEPEPHSQHICPSCGGDIATTDGIHTCTRCGKSTTNPQPKMTEGTPCPPEIWAKLKGGAA